MWTNSCVGHVLQLKLQRVCYLIPSLYLLMIHIFIRVLLGSFVWLIQWLLYILGLLRALGMKIIDHKSKVPSKFLSFNWFVHDLHFRKKLASGFLNPNYYFLWLGLMGRLILLAWIEKLVCFLFMFQSLQPAFVDADAVWNVRGQWLSWIS